MKIKIVIFIIIIITIIIIIIIIIIGYHQCEHHHKILHVIFIDVILFITNFAPSLWPFLLWAPGDGNQWQKFKDCSSYKFSKILRPSVQKKSALN